MNLADRYISRTLLAATAVVALVVAALVALTVFIGQADDIGDGSYGILKVSAFTLLSLPGNLYLVLPVIALLGALLALGSLAAGSELIVMRASGMSMTRLARSVSLAGIVLALLAAAVGEYVGPAATRSADTLRAQARHGEVADHIDDGLWLRQGNRFLRIDAILPGGGIDGLDVYTVTGDGRMTRTLVARHATLDHHRLRIDNPHYTDIDSDHTETGSPPSLTLNVTLDPRVLRLAVTAPDELSTLGLWRYIQYLDANGIDDDDYRLAMWRNIVNPFTAWVMVVFALPFAFGALRSAGAGQRLFSGGLIGLVFFLVNEIVASSGSVYGLPAWLAAGLPTALLALATAAWIRRLS